MAAAIQDQAALDFAATLAPADIPTKLRCAVCNKLAVNAFKLPCCDQAICQYCQAALPESCPVCSHSPLEADMCKPNKALRMTIKIHIKTEEKKRAAAESATPAIETPAPAPEPPVEKAQAQAPASTELVSQDAASGAPDSHDAAAGPGATGPADQLDELSHGQPQPEHTEHVNQTPGVEPDTIIQTTEGEEQAVKDAHNQDPNAPQQQQHDDQQPDADQNQVDAVAFGADASNPNFNTMDWNANGFNNNPMMNMPNMMMNMPGAFPNMMGMSMGPMSMYGGFTPNGMGMNDMNGMNMGMGFGGSFGNNWNGQQQQQQQQQQGMGGGNFGAGYYPNAGYNQQQMHQGAYGNQMHHQQFPTHNYQNRFQAQGQRGFGRGGRGGFAGRGGHHVNQFQAQAHHHSQTQPSSGPFGTAAQTDDATFPTQPPDAGLQGDRRPSQPASATAMSVEPTLEKPDDQPAMPVDEDQAHNQHVHDITTNLADDQIQDNGQGNDYDAAHGVQLHQAVLPQPQHFGDMNSERFNMTAAQAFDPDMSQQYPMDQSQADGFYAGNNFQPGFAYRGRGGFRGRGRGRGGHFNSYDAFSAHQQDNFTVVAGLDAGPPINAPTGPKAMREGKPNTGFYSRQSANASVPPAPKSIASQRDRSVSAIKEAEPEVSLEEKPRERSRSRSSQRKRKYRRRSASASTEDEEARERRRERRRHHEEKYEDEKKEEHADGDGSSSRKDRTRSSSPRDDSKSGRSRRDRDGRHKSSHSRRDTSKEHRRDRHRHRSRSPGRADEEPTNGVDDVPSESSRHRSRRERGTRDRDSGRDRDRDREREKEKDRKRSSRRDRSASPSQDAKHSSSRRDRRDQRPDDRRDAMAPPPAASDDLGFKIKGSRSNNNAAPASAPSGPSAASTSTFAPPTGPKKDRERDRLPRRDRHPERNADYRDKAREERERGKDRERERDRNGTHKDRPSDSRRQSTQSNAPVSEAAPVAAATAVDPHALEREARNRERMLKEQQRRESASTALGKRSRGDLDDDGASAGGAGERRGSGAVPTGPRAERRDAELDDERGDRDRERGVGAGAAAGGEGRSGRRRKNRRVSYKYEDEENHERRAERVEAEREAGRWG